MKHLLFPDAYYDSTFDIDYKALKKRGFLGLLFDIDNTLTIHNVKAEKKEARFCDYLHRLGFRTVVMSNNSKDRVEPFAKLLGTSYISRAQKPLSWAYKKAMDMIETNKDNTLFIGDQLYTDIMGANIAGLKSILVRPISSHESSFIKVKRIIEKPVVSLYELSHKKNHINF